jgi:acyl-CoA dehydrogenase
MQLTPEEKHLREIARKFVNKEIIPIRASADQTGEFPVNAVKAAHRAGLLTAHIPEEHGGAGLGLFPICLIAEELAGGCAGIGTSLLVNMLGTSTIMLFGSENQKARYLRTYCDEALLFSFACTEPGSGSDIAGITTNFREDGDSVLLSGQKAFITNASYADYFTVFAKRAGSGRGYSTLSAFVVSAKQEGVSVGKPLSKLGQRGSNTAPVFFDEVRVPSAARLGRVGEGLAIATHALARSRLGIAAAAVGLATAALDVALQYTKQRRQFGKPISDFQLVQGEIAELWEKVEACRALVYVAGRAYDAGDRSYGRIYAAKDFASKAAMDVVNRCVALLGAYGYIRDYPLEKMLRDARLLEIYEGSSNMQKLMLFQELRRTGSVLPPL